ncbi:MAG: GNAT family N-acetyltransferase [Bdellovibrio sp.]|nr:GNAT family N-acetyltransferase [Bdellovibrio sp.]
MTNSKQNLLFNPVQLALHAQTCIRFREDSFVVSFDDARKFYEADGKGAERYIEWLNSKIAKDPKSVVHIWKNEEIVGQIELGLLKNEFDCGYVNLFYLIPSVRGQGFGAALDQHAVEHFRALGFHKMKLSVSPTNTRAVSFYKKLGWIDLGPRPGHPEINFMEKKI